MKAILYLVPILILILTATTRYHGLMWQEVSIHPQSGALDCDFGILFYVWNMYANALILGAVIIYVRAIRRLRGVYRWQAIAMIFAMLPLAMGTGLGSETNAPMSIAIIGGLLSSMVLTLLIVPVMYRLINPIDRWLRKFYEGKIEE